MQLLSGMQLVPGMMFSRMQLVSGRLFSGRLFSSRLFSGTKKNGSRAMLPALVAALSVVLAIGATTAQGDVSVGSRFESRNLSPFLEFYADQSGRLKLEDVRNLPTDAWVLSTSSNVSFGFTDSIYWFRLVVTNNQESVAELLLAMEYARFDQLEVFELKPGGAERRMSGTAVDFRLRAIPHRHHLFPIQLAPGESRTIFLRGQTTGSFQFPLTLWSRNAFLDSDERNTLLLGAYFGICLLIMTYNLVLYAVIHHRALASFVGFMFSFGVYQICTLGLGTDGIWSTFPILFDAGPVFSIGMCLLCLARFCDHLLDLRETDIVGLRVLQLLQVLTIAVMAAYLFLPYATVIPLLAVLTIPMAAAVFGVGAVSAWQGNRLGLYCTVSWTALLIGIGLRAGNRLDLLPTNFVTEQAAPTGFVAMMLILSFAIAAEIRRHNRQNQEVLLTEHQEVQTEHRVRNEELEQKVAERTAELKAALSELSSAHETLKEVNTIDAVTNIKNRQYFEDIFDQEWKRANRQKYAISLMLLDIDLFKRVNDTYGHLAGDECLRQVAEAIRASLRRPADILARYGGEEFVVVLPYLENENAMMLANTIRRRVEQTELVADGHDLSLTVSIGVSTATPTDADDRKDLISAADIALYGAKNSGRNQVRNAGLLTVHQSARA
jgi:diguanylate cyclase (GGDEF)-like protein